MARKSRKPEAIQVVASVPMEVEYNTALYLRLSVMDMGRDDSESIVNQEELLRGYVAENPELVIKGVFTDNGETGTNLVRVR